MNLQAKMLIGFTASDGFLGKTIQKFTKGDVNHVLLAYFDAEARAWMNHGAVGRGFIPEFAGRGPGPEIKGLKYLYDVGDLFPGFAANAELIGRPYDYLGLLGMTWVEFAWHRLKRQAKNPLDADNALFCSEIVRKIIRASPAVREKFPSLVLRDSSTDPEMLQAVIEKAGILNLVGLAPTPAATVAA